MTENENFIFANSIDVAMGDILCYELQNELFFATMTMDEQGDYFDGVPSNYTALLRAYAVQTTSVLLPYRYGDSQILNVTINVASTLLNMTEMTTVEFVEAINDTTIIVDDYVPRGDEVYLTVLPHTGEYILYL